MPDPNPGSDSYENLIDDLIEDLDGRLAGLTRVLGQFFGEVRHRNVALESVRARAEKAEARVAELEATFVKWAPIVFAAKPTFGTRIAEFVNTLKSW